MAIFELPQMELTGSQLAQICPITPVQECLPSKYRTVSGQCNNVYKPLQGAVYEPFQRFILPDYSDGMSIKVLFIALLVRQLVFSHKTSISHRFFCFKSFKLFTAVWHQNLKIFYGAFSGISFPRRSVTGSLLPNARKISRDIITDNIQEHNVCSAMIPQWAMFVYEDLAQIGSNQLVKGFLLKNFYLACYCKKPKPSNVKLL